MTDELSVEERAAQLGHVPQDQWKGDPEKWVDAETFLHRAEEALPLAKSNLKRLANELAATKGTVSQLQSVIQENQKAMEDFRKFQIENLESALRDQEARIRAELKEAREDGDVRRETELENKLDDVKDQRRDLKKNPPKVEQPQTTVDPVFEAWKADNDWYGADLERTALADSIALRLRQDPANRNLTGLRFFNDVKSRVEKILGPVDGSGDDGESVSKVSAGRTTSVASTGGAAKGYASLPAEARAQCDADARRFVGENKMFKDEKAWRDHFVTLYNRARGV